MPPPPPLHRYRVKFYANAPDNFLERELSMKRGVNGALHFPFISIHGCQIRKKVSVYRVNDKNLLFMCLKCIGQLSCHKKFLDPPNLKARTFQLQNLGTM